ncbi:MAG: hypothetical protein PHV97_02835 [Candidatus Omnitrophica bacterium]|nr:hypothetical protein [Candidatus Omnitrophota bacterium]
MAEDNGEFPVKKLIILLVLIGVLILTLLPRFTSKPKGAFSQKNGSTQGSVSVSGNTITKRPFFKNLPPEVQARLLAKRPRQTN